MARNKKKVRKVNKPDFSQPPSPGLPEQPLSDKWYNNIEICDVLGMSIATVKRRRKDGSLKASKKYGKICFNAYHVEQFLKGGLPKAVAAFAFVARILEGAREIAMAL